jgi:hypothetical protein
MANPDQLAHLKNSVSDWNSWRLTNRDITADLSGADLRGANLRGADLTKADLRQAVLAEANLREADLSRANFRRADLSQANLRRTDLSGANLSRANFRRADLSQANLMVADFGLANLSGADLSGADLKGTILIGANLNEANLTGCAVYGLSAWDVQLEGAIQANLVITPADAPAITVDNLAVAQFVYLLLNNKNVRHVIDTITSKVVLILGRSLPSARPFSTPSGMNFASGTTCQFCSISRNQRAVTSLKPSRRWPTWPGS